MRLIKKISVFVCLLTLVVLPTMALAQAVEAPTEYFPSAFETTVSETLPTSADVPTVVAKVINIVLGFLGIVAVVIILAGGFLWMTAGGGEEKVGKAKKLLIAGIIGLVIILSAYAIAAYVIGSLKGAITT